MEDEIAVTEILALAPNGDRHAVRLSIRRPSETVQGSWSCKIGGHPLVVHSPRDGLHGVDSFQALAIALAFIRGQLDDFIGSGGRLLDPNHPEADVDIGAMFGSLGRSNSPRNRP